MSMIEFRCIYCNKLLAKVDGLGITEIKCQRCNRVNTFNPSPPDSKRESDDPPEPGWKDFEIKRK